MSIYDKVVFTSSLKIPGATKWRMLIFNFINWRFLMGFMDKVKEELEKKANLGGGTSSGITVSTAPIQGNYNVIDVIFAFDSHKEGIFTNANPEKAFDKVVDQLRAQCKKRGGDAVISCQFEYRVAVASGLTGSKQAIEIFAYGTVVKIT
jgi:uncharacterized protein YbjQ (UPF0145 family)